MQRQLTQKSSLQISVKFLKNFEITSRCSYSCKTLSWSVKGGAMW